MNSHKQSPLTPDEVADPRDRVGDDEPVVIDLGAGRDPDPRSTLTADLYATADYQVNLEDDWPWPAGSVDGLVARHVIEHLDDDVHALREAARVLRPGGWFEVVQPVGLNARADGDHVWESLWTWRTPEYNLGARHWDEEADLELVSRDVDVWPHLPTRFDAPLRWPLRAARAVLGPGPWLFDVPLTSGEFTVHFRKPGED